MSRFDHARFRSYASLFAVAAVAVFLMTPAEATIQNDQIGFTPNHVFEGALSGENVDIMNGNVNLRIPIGPRYMLNDWFGYQLELYYNSKIWLTKCSGDPGHCPGYLVNPDTYGAGFTLHFGRIYHHPEDLSYIYRYQTPDGADHFFCHDGNTTGGDCLFDDRTIDTSAMRVIQGAPGWVVYPGDGTIIKFTHNAGVYDPDSNLPAGGWYATRIETIAQSGSEAQQWVEIAYAGATNAISSITDSAGAVPTDPGRTITFIYAGTDVTIRVPSFGDDEDVNAASVDYYLDTGLTTVHDPDHEDTHNIKLLDKLTIPLLDTNEKYVFDYNSAGLKFGYLKGWTLPTGATVRYNYMHYRGNPKIGAYHSEIVSRTLQLVPGGEEHSWVYTRAGSEVARTADQAIADYQGQDFSGSNPFKVRLVDPFGNLTVYWFKWTPLCSSTGCLDDCDVNGCESNWWDGLLWKIEVYAGSEEIASRMVKRELYTHTYDNYMHYKFTPPNLDERNRMGVNVRKVEDEVTMFGGLNHPARTHRVVQTDWANVNPDGSIDYQKPALAREVREYDDWELYRSTYTDYQPNDNFHNNHTFVEQRDKFGQVLSRADKKFDWNRLRCEVQRLDGSSPTGWTCANPGLAYGDIETENTFHAVTGSLETTEVTDGMTTFTTEYTYLNGVLETKRHVSTAFDWFAVDRDIDGNTGLVRKSRDPAGTTTSYNWDGLGRLKQIAAGNNESPIDISYCSLHETRVVQAIAAGSDETESVYFYDNLGRVVEERRRNLYAAAVSQSPCARSDSPSPGYDTRLSEYDIAGRLLQQSDWKAINQSPLWTTYDYSIPGDDPVSSGVCRISIFTLLGQDRYEPGGGSHAPCLSDANCPAGECSVSGTPGGPCYDGDVYVCPWPHVCGSQFLTGECTGSDHHRCNAFHGQCSNFPGSTCEETVFEDLGPREPEYCDLSLGDGSGLIDPLGRVSKVTRPDGGITTTQYDGLATTVTVHGIQGTAGLINASTTYVNDVFGRLASVDAPHGADASYVYDEQDNLVEVQLTDPAPPPGGLATQLRRFVYDGLGRLETATNPESGTVEYLGYNPRGNLLEYRDAAGNEFENIYDAASRLLTKNILSADGTAWVPLVTNSYDQYDGGEGTAAGPALGKLTKQVSRRYDPVSSGSVTTATKKFFYGKTNSAVSCPVPTADAPSYVGLNGRLAWATTQIEPWSQELQTELCYDALGQTKVIRYPDYTGSPSNQRTELAYMHLNGFLWEVHDVGRGPEYIKNVHYDQHGAPLEILRGNDVSLVIDRDAQGRPLNYELLGLTYESEGHNDGEDPHNCNGGCIGGQNCHLEDCDPPPPPGEQDLEWQTGAYSYDLAGNVIQIGADTYRYDAIQRLTSAYVAESSLTHTYDAFGNMLSRTRVKGMTTDARTFTVNRSTNRLEHLERTVMNVTTNRDYLFDANGSMLSDDVTGYVFDEQNRLVQAWNQSDDEPLGKYDYDADGYRVHSVVDGTESFYFRDGSGGLLAEYRRSYGSPEAPVWNQEYIYALGQAVTLLQNEVPKTPARPWITSFSSTNKTLQLHWAASDEPDFSDYKIERVVNSAPATEIWTSSPPFNDNFSDVPNLATSTITYRVVARDTAANVSAKSAPLVVYPYDTTPPAMPTGLQGSPGEGFVSLTWNDNTEPDLWGYNVEKKPPISWVRMNEAPLTEAEYHDFNVNQDTLYFYRVRAVDTQGRESAPTEQLAQRPVDHTPPAIPTHVRAQADYLAGSIRILWDPVLDFDLGGYVVKNSAGVDQTVSANTTEAVVTGLIQGQVHSYTVRAFDDASTPNHSLESEAVSAQTRSTSVSTPGSLMATSVIDDNGTTAGGATGCPEADDIVGINVSWTRAASGPTVFRVYRAPVGTEDYAMIYQTSASLGFDEVCSTGTQYACAYFDANVSGGYRYYVVGVNGSSIESAAQSPPAEVVGSFNPTRRVECIYAYDGRTVFGNDNSSNNRSRQVSVHWAPVATPGLQGYHVYRKCEWERCSNSAWLATRNFTCSHGWQRLTESPVTGQTEFTDLATGDLNGCFVYAVRTVGPNKEEGEIESWVEPGCCIHSAVLAVSLWNDGHVDNPQLEKDLSDVTMDSSKSPTDTHTEIARVNAIQKGTGSPAGAPGAPLLNDLNGPGVNNWGVMSKKISPPGGAPYWMDRATRWAWVEWLPGCGALNCAENDLAGYHVEMGGSTEGPWRRITTAPVAWWETRYDVKALWVEGYTDGSWVGSQCVTLRVIAVDDNGNESAPSVAQQVPEGCAGTNPVPTVAAPQITVSTGSVPNPGCSNLLEWDRVYEATSYRVYRARVPFSQAPFFYRTHTLVDADCSYLTGRCQYEEDGDLDPENNYSDHSENNDCPLDNDWNNAVYVAGVGWVGGDCYQGGLEAYYVTAVGASGAESPPSNIVFWTCNEGYVRLESEAPVTEGIASNTPSPSSLSVEEICMAGPDPELTRLPQDSQTATAPLLTLGQAAPNPPYAIYDLHADHLGSTRVVTNDAGEVVSYHDFYPFGEEIADFYDYNRKLYTGHERDDETGLDYMLARYYGASLSRFLSTDPAFEIHKSVHNPQRWNRYSYVLNNPLAFIDPTGEVLKVSGSASAKDKFKDTADDGLMGKEVNVATDGTVTLDSTGEEGPPTEEQAALEDSLNQAISDPATTSISLTESSPVIIAEFGTGEIDMNDVQALGTTPGVSAVGTLGHEIAEQYARQVQGAGYNRAHKIGMAAEDRINGSVRGMQGGGFTPNADGTFNGTMVIPYSEGGTKTISTINVIRNDVVNVTERTK